LTVKIGKWYNLPVIIYASEKVFMSSNDNNEKCALSLLENQQLLPLMSKINAEDYIKMALSSLDNILIRFNQEQIELFFNVLCDIKQIGLAERAQMFAVFSVANEYMIFENFYYDMTKKSKTALLFEQFSLDNILKHSQRRDFSNLTRDRLVHFLHGLPNVQTKLSAVEQDEFIQKTFRIIQNQIISLFTDLPVHSLYQHPQLHDLLHQIFTLKESVEQNEEITHIIANLKHNHLMTQDMENEWYKTVTHHDSASNQSHAVYEFTRDIQQGLAQGNQDLLFKGIDAYIEYYLITENKSRKEKQLFLDDKIEAFYSAYYANLQNVWDSSLINALLHYYHKDIFFAFMQRYDIDFAIPLSFQGQYLSLAEFSCYHKLHLIDDMLAQNIDVWQPFSHKLIVHKEITHIKYEPFNFNICYNQDTVCKMIEKRLIRHDMSFDGTNIFYTLLNKEYYHAFCLLYEYSTQDFSGFSLKTLSDAHPYQDFLSLYLSSKGKNQINLDILNIFVKEQFDLTKINEDGTRAIDLIIQDNQSNTIQLVKSLFPLFSQEYKTPYQLQSNTTPDFHSKVSEKEKNQKLVQWYDELKLVKHLDHATGAKVKFLQKMAEAHNSYKPVVNITDESFFDDLLAKHPNFADVIYFYKGQFRQIYYGTKKRVSPVLLLGNPGIGKTHFAKQLALHLNSGYAFIDMASITANWVLNGASGSWQDAKQGKIIDIMMQSPTVNPLVVLDELDKAGGSKYDATGTLYQLLEEVNAKEFTDEFLDFSFDVSGMIYVASANSLHGISEPLLSRFKVFTVPGPDKVQLRSIIGNIYQEAIADNPLMNPVLHPSVIDMVQDSSLREIKIQLEDGISHALLSVSRQELDVLKEQGKMIDLTVEHLREKIQQVKMGF
jgi:hypothetical protein